MSINLVPNIGYNTPGKQKIFATKITMLRNNLGKKDAKSAGTLISDAYSVIEGQKSTNAFHTGKHTKTALKAITQEVLNIVDKNDSELNLDDKKKILTTLDLLKDHYPNAFDSRLIGELDLKIAENKNSLMEQNKIQKAEKARLKQIENQKVNEELEGLQKRLDNLK